MHRDYLKKAEEKSLLKIAYSTFRRIFKEERNISCWQPKRDLCGVCATFENTSSEEYQMHKLNKDMIRSVMQNDKAYEDRTKFCASFDLQKPKTIPSTEIGDIYYLR